MIFKGNRIETSIINEFKIREIYEFYDQPIFYSFYNELDSLFLALLLHENNISESWLYLGISHKDLLKLEKGEMRVREHLDQVINQTCYVYEINRVNDKKEFYLSNLNNIDKNYLPDYNYELELNREDTLLKWEFNEESVIKNNTYILDLRLLMDNNPSIHTIEVDVIGRVLTLIQELIFSFALPKNAKVTSKYSKETRENNRALLVSTNPGSFKLRIESEKTVSLLGNDPFALASTELIKLFDNYDNLETISELFKNNNEKTNRKIVELVYNLKGNNISGEIKFAQPFGSSVSSLSSSFDSNKLINIIDKFKNMSPEKRSLKINCLLIAIDTRSKKFTIKDEDDKLYNGYIEKVFFDEIIDKSKFTVPSMGLATLEIKSERNNLTDLISEKYIMIDWNEEKDNFSK